MPTTRDAVNSTVSTTTTHFSQYMVVDSQKWYANWNNSLSELRKMWTAGTSYQRNLHTILMMDCSSSAYSSDPYSPSLKVGYNGVTSENIEDIRNSINSQWDAEYYCGQIVKSSATQSEKKILKHLEGSQKIKTFARTIVDEIDNVL